MSPITPPLDDRKKSRHGLFSISTGYVADLKSAETGRRGQCSKGGRDSQTRTGPSFDYFPFMEQEIFFGR